MSKSYNKFHTLLLAVLMMFGSASAFAVTFPALELDSVAVTSDNTGLTMSGTVPYILSDPTTMLVVLIPDLSFSLTSNAAGAGSLQVDGGLALSATFSDLMITSIVGGTVTWSADLTYTGGSLAGGLTAGLVEGGFNGINGFSMGQSLLGETFSGTGGLGKLGAVSAVPVPAAVWLFGSGLLGLAGIARRTPRA